VSELGTPPAADCCHDALPGLPQRPPAAFLFDGDGVLLMADWAMMNLANLSSFELISLCTSCKIETCSVSCEMVDTCEVIVWVSEVLAFVAVEVFAAFWVLVVAVRRVWTELMAVFMVDNESVTDLSSTLIFLHLVGIASAVSISQYRPSVSESAWFNISSLLFRTRSSFGSQ